MIDGLETPEVDLRKGKGKIYINFISNIIII